ncbi:MAG TPA: serine/threonine-protein kinase [Polyangia bacterium]|nr:serine/threonine-protein kinase [Polyangia bacterium]
MDMIGRQLSRYRLLQEVGQGGMAVVYKATDTTLNREVAVKVLHPHLAGQQESRARLQREAHAVAKLRHENILEIFDYSGPDSAESYIVTEFIHGRTLKNFLVDSPLPCPEVAEMIASEVARALEHAHQFGVIHRDVKPENVMIRDDGLIKLTDFGIAQIVDKERMTVTGQLLGSPAYMAPEHVEGRPLDFRTDVFAVGILTYQLATGQLPFRGKNPHEVLKRIAECRFQPADAVNPLVGKRLNRVIDKALQREPDARYSDVGELRRELMEDLADAGVEDARAELGRFFKDPKGWARAFEPRLVAALTASGKTRAAAGRTAAALELWGRALSHQPHGEAAGELRGLVDGVSAHERRARTIKRGLAVAGALVVVSAAGLGARHWLKTHPTVQPAAHVAPPSGAKLTTLHEPHSTFKTGVAVEPTHDKPTAPVAKKHVAPPHERPPVVTAPTVPPRNFELAPTPKAVTVFLDGKRLGDYGPQLQELSIPAGHHIVRFESPYCFPKDVEIGDAEPSGRLAARLRWKPARLTVKTDPDTADVLVDGSILRSGQPLDVNIPDFSDGKKSVNVKVSAPGYTTKTVPVELRANDQHLESVTLVEKAAGE